jgi:hypothetical protein
MRIESPDIPPEAMPLGRKNKLNPMAIINEPMIIHRVSHTCLAGPFKGKTVFDLRLRAACAITVMLPFQFLTVIFPENWPNTKANV